jgi:hypothetical protein
VNHYDPAQNLTAKAVWLSISTATCGGGFYSAFRRDNNGRTEYEKTYTSPSAGPTLIRIEMRNKTIAVNNGTHKDDNYELLAKGIGAYNQGVGVWNTRPKWSWLDLLIDAPSSKRSEYVKFTKLIAEDAKKKAQAKNLGAPAYNPSAQDIKNLKEANDYVDKYKAVKTAMEYALDILHGNPDPKLDKADFLKMPYRKYIWKVITTANNPATPENEEQAYCFAYGEQEWLSGKNWNEIKQAAQGSVLKNPVGRIGCDSSKL